MGLRPGADYQIAHLKISTNGPDSSAAALLNAALRGFRLQRIYPQSKVDTIPLYAGRLKLRWKVVLPEATSGQLLRATADWQCWRQSDSIQFALKDVLVVIPQISSPQNVEVWLKPDQQWPLDVLGQVFGCALHALLQPHGLHYLHGAGLLAPKGGPGVLIVGASGSGKSTLTLRLIASGWQYLTDDLLLLDGRLEHSDAAILAHGFRRHFAVSTEALRHSGLLKTTGVNADEHQDKTYKHWLLPEKFFPTGYVAQCLPQILILPQVTQAPESHLEPISPQDALLTVLHETPLAGYDPTIRRAQVNTLTRLVSQTRAWRLYAGRDLLEQPDRASQLLASLF